MPTPVLSPMDWLRRDRPRNRLVARHGVRACPRTSPGFSQVLSDQTGTSYFTLVSQEKQKKHLFLFTVRLRPLLEGSLRYVLRDLYPDGLFSSNSALHSSGSVLHVAPRVHLIRNELDIPVRHFKQSY